MATRKALTLEERVSVIKQFANGDSSRKLAAKFGVGRTQIQQTIKRKAEYLSEYESECNPQRKRQRRPTGNEDINDLVWNWYCDASARNIEVTGPLIQEKALQFAKDLKNETFKASNGWLQCFVTRHNLVFKKMSGERGDVNDKTVDDYRRKIPDICSGYKDEDIFNMDETGLFFKDGKLKTYSVKGAECPGGKRSKERVTVALCASKTGEKLTPLVIGKSKKPRAFKKIKIENLPVMYRNNKKAWMTGKVFEEWLKHVNKKMRKQKRKILLLVDNAPCHPDLSLKYVKLSFLPPNTTSKIQPMDQGIIQTFKLKFHKKQSNKILSEMDKHKSMTGTELLKQINILDAVYWVAASWNEVEAGTITKCFNKGGFYTEEDPMEEDDCDEMNESDNEADEDDLGDDDNVPLGVLALCEVYNCSYNDILNMEQDAGTCDESMTDWTRPAGELLQTLKETESTNATDDDDDDDDDDESGDISQSKLISLCDVESAVDLIKRFALDSGECKMLDAIMSVANITDKLKLKKCNKQPTLTEFLLRY